MELIDRKISPAGAIRLAFNQLRKLIRFFASLPVQQRPVCREEGTLRPKVNFPQRSAVKVFQFADSKEIRGFEKKDREKDYTLLIIRISAHSFNSASVKVDCYKL